MQQHYEVTATEKPPQTETLPHFLESLQITLPQLSDQQKEALQEEITQNEIITALQEASENSASGPSGQSISFFKLIFCQIPELFTMAMNQLVFTPGLLNCPEFEWIRNRKVIYIPKKHNPTSPADYRPLSMLEVLYKIPSRIFSRRLTSVLPTLIGQHQHGFMKQKGIQEPSLIMTHLIQDANRRQLPLQLISFDIEKAFDRVSHEVIIQALRCFGFPEIFTHVIQEYTLQVFAMVEVNSSIGNPFSILRGSGQGDPMSSSLFLIATEPINLAIIKKSIEIQYMDGMGNKYPPTLFADDNLSPLNLGQMGKI